MKYVLPKRLTLRDLKPILEFYHEHLPDWRVIHQDTLAREAGPVVQAVTFDRLSAGDYRPTGYIHVLAAPAKKWYFELCQYLNPKVRNVYPRAHLQLRDQVVAAIRRELVPDVTAPLVPEEVLRLYEDLPGPTVGKAYSLAALNAYLGQESRATWWIAQYRQSHCVTQVEADDEEVEEHAFLSRLEGWLAEGTAREHLDEVIQSERVKAGLA